MGTVRYALAHPDPYTLAYSNPGPNANSYAVSLTFALTIALTFTIPVTFSGGDDLER